MAEWHAEWLPHVAFALQSQRCGGGIEGGFKQAFMAGIDLPNGNDGVAIDANGVASVRGDDVYHPPEVFVEPRCKPLGAVSAALHELVSHCRRFDEIDEKNDRGKASASALAVEALS